MFEGDKVEFQVPCIGHFSSATNLINWYGSHESRQSVEEIKEHYDKLMKEIISIVI